MQRSQAILLLCAALATGVAQAHVRNGIAPPLEPKSDKKFFGPPFPADYPDDGRPAVPISKKFDHPYPIVQDSGSFDKDFVGDENNDNGEWAAQFAYDKLRGQLRMKKKAVESAGKKKEDEEHSYSKTKMEAQAEEAKYNKTKDELTKTQKKYVDEEFKKQEAEIDAKKAADDASAKEKAAEEASKDAEAAATVDEEGGADGDAEGAKGKDASKLPMADKVAAAKQKVEDKIKNLEGCKQELEDAKNELKEVFAKQKKAEEEAVANKTAALKEDKDKAAAQKERAEKALKEADAASAASKDDLAEAQKGADEEKVKLDKAKMELEAEERKRKRVTLRYQEEVEDLEATEADLKAAEAKVKALRAKVDKGGGVVPAPEPKMIKSAAPRLLASNSLAALIVAMSVASAMH